MAITTNRQYITSKLNRFGLSEDDIDAIMVENPLLAGSLDVTLCKTAIYNSMSSILPTANVSEGGYSINWNMDALKLWYRSLCNELGKPNVLNAKVSNRSNRW